MPEADLTPLAVTRTVQDFLSESRSRSTGKSLTGTSAREGAGVVFRKRANRSAGLGLEAIDLAACRAVSRLYPFQAPNKRRTSINCAMW